MECVCGCAAVVCRIGERLDDGHELCHRPRPAVRQDHRGGVVMGRADMKKMDVESVDLGQAVVIGVDLALEASPVVLGRPVLAQRLGVGEGNALRPVINRLRFGPAGACQALAQIVDCRVGYVDGEGPDVVAHIRIVAGTAADSKPA